MAMRTAPTGTTTEPRAKPRHPRPHPILRAVIDFPDTAPGAASGDRLRASFEQPKALIEAWTLADVMPALAQVQAHANAGCWCIGGVAYEAAPAFDASLRTHPPDGRWPLVRFGVYEAPLTHALPLAGEQSAANWAMSASRARYLTQVQRAQQAMAAGECYQVNLTSSLTGTLAGEPSAWMRALSERQPGGYLLWLDGGSQHVVSASPELFFDWQPDGSGGQLRCRPMKGTAGRESDPQRDAAARERLLASPKEQAENVMIVDLLRNDLNRIAIPDSVRVDQLLEAEAWPTVWQMTSSISARARPGIQLPDVMRALFPCGSVTGAPKSQAMRWIHDLEDGARGLYCGALGVVRPGGHATFNVPIRTLLLQQQPASGSPPTWQARYGVGSGLTVYADPASEWEEMMTKTQILHTASEPFQLLETLRLEAGAYTLLDRHLQRLQDSARHFNYPCDASAIRVRLDQLVRSGHSHGLWRVRLTLDASGAIDLRAMPMSATGQPVHVALAPESLTTTGALQAFIQHKTTRRAHYEALAPTDPGVFDHLLYNHRGELTEFTRGNVALRLNGQWLTPALSCGLLNGTYRAELLASGHLSEATLTANDLKQAQGLAFFNSLRGWLDATLTGEAETPQAAATPHHSA
jgi:para-aminobenzoate synthetase / 4-amino-4-deoxychorismate lyase